MPKASRPWSASAWAAKYRLPQRGPSCSPKAGCLGSRGALLVFKHPLLLRFELTSEGRIRTSSQSQSTGPVPWTPAQVGGAQVRGRSTAKVDFSDARGPGPAARGACLPSTEWPKGCSYPPTRPPSSRSSRVNFKPSLNPKLKVHSLYHFYFKLCLVIISHSMSEFFNEI